MANPVTTAHLAARWRPLSSAERIVAQSLLDDVWAKLRRKITTLDDDLAANTVTVDELVSVECAAVLRVMKNPDALRQESIGTFSHTFDTGTASPGLLYITDAELAELGHARPRARGQYMGAAELYGS